MTGRWRLYHTACDATVGYYDIEPVVGDVMMASHAMLPNDSRPMDGEPVACPRCGEIPTWAIKWSLETNTEAAA